MSCRGRAGPSGRGAAGSGGSRAGNELGRTAVCRLPCALGVMGAVQVCRGQTWKGGSKTILDRGPGSLTFSVSQCLCPLSGGRAARGGWSWGCPFVYLSGLSAPSLRQLSSYSSEFSVPGSGSHKGLCLWGSEPASCDSPYLPIGLLICGGLRLALRPHFPGRSKRGCQLFSAFSFLLVKTEWHLPASYVPDQQSLLAHYISYSLVPFTGKVGKGLLFKCI